MGVTMKYVGLVVTWLLSSGFYITWTHPGSSGGFEVQRKTQGGTYASAGKVGDVRVYQDTSALQQGTTYCYQVRASGTIPSSWSTEACQVYAGVRITIPAGQTVLISRRATTGASTVSILVNANQVMAENQPTPPANALTVNMRPGLTLLTSWRATSGATTVSLLVNQNEVVSVNGVKQ